MQRQMNASWATSETVVPPTSLDERGPRPSCCPFCHGTEEEKGAPKKEKTKQPLPGK